LTQEETDTGVADLHMHTTASDGKSTVGERIEQAHERGLEAIAITDHDRIPEELNETSVERRGVEVITGVEAKTEVFGEKVEILGYYVDPDAELLSEVLAEARRYREERNREMVEDFVEVTGVQTTYEELSERADGQVGRPTFADLLIEEGLVDSVSQAFEEYLGEDGDIYSPIEKVRYSRVIKSIHDAGGVASMAHPGRIGSDRVPEMVEKLVDEGMDGIEVWYPYGEVYEEGEAGVGTDEALKLADRHGLLKTGGSDCHGKGSGKYRIGDVRVPQEEFSKIREAVS